MITHFLLLSAIASRSFASILERRADPPPPQPTRFTIPLRTNDQKYTARIGMGKEGSLQEFNFAFSTTLGYTMVAGGDCPTCLQSSSGAGYNLTSSATPLNGSASISISGGSASGSRIRENCFLRTNTDTWWPYPNQTIVLANQTSNGFFSGNISGIVGLGTKGTTNESDTFISGLFRSRSAWTNVTFALALNPTVRVSGSEAGLANATGDGGAIHLVNPDLTFKTGEVASQVVQGIGDAEIPGGLPSADWAVQLDAWKFTAGSLTVGNPAGGRAILEPFSLGIFVPQSEANAIYGSIPGSAVKSLRAGAMGISYSVPCGSQMTFATTFDTVTITLDQNDLVTNTGGECVGVIQGWANDSSIYLLGSAFASKSYLIFTAQKAEGEPNTVGIAVRSFSSPATPTAVGAIVGGVLGGLAVIAIFIALCWWFFIRQPRKKPERISVGMPRDHGETLTGASSNKKRPTPEKEMMIIEPFQLPPSEPPSSTAYRDNFTPQESAIPSSTGQPGSDSEHQQLLAQPGTHQSLYFTDPGSPVSDVSHSPTQPTYVGGFALPGRESQAFGSALGSSDLNHNHPAPLTPNRPAFFVSERNPNNRLDR